jgi:hypothetical protein
LVGTLRPPPLHHNADQLLPRGSSCHRGQKVVGRLKLPVSPLDEQLSEPDGTREPAIVGGTRRNEERVSSSGSIEPTPVTRGRLARAPRRRPAAS